MGIPTHGRPIVSLELAWNCGGPIFSRKTATEFPMQITDSISAVSRACATFRAFMWLQLHGADQKRWIGWARTPAAGGKMGNFLA